MRQGGRGLVQIPLNNPQLPQHWACFERKCHRARDVFFVSAAEGGYMGYRALLRTCDEHACCPAPRPLQGSCCAERQVAAALRTTAAAGLSRHWGPDVHTQQKMSLQAAEAAERLGRARRRAGLDCPVHKHAQLL